MAKKVKNVSIVGKMKSNVNSYKTIASEKIKKEKLKLKIADRKATNAAFSRMRNGKATAADSARLAQAKAENMNKKKGKK